MGFRELYLGLALAASSSVAIAENSDATTLARERPLFAIVYTAGPNWKPGVEMKDQGLRDHFFYVKRLFESGAVALAGPMGPDGGLMLVHAHDRAAADAIVAGDPAVTAGLFVGKVQQFTPAFAADHPVSAQRR